MMNDLEEIWEQSFSQLGYKLDLVKPNYQEMEHDDRVIASLYWLELEMYNGGFVQFFCNWGYDAYLLAVEGLEQIGAINTKELLLKAYSIIEKFEDDERLEELWDLPEYLTQSDDDELSKIDEEYWQDKEQISRLMLLKFHPDSIKNIDNKES